MSDNSTGFHERTEDLRPETRDRHRAIVSLMEELEAVDWYDQRIDATEDAELRAILAHNRDEEKEHAAMLIEWLRRRDATFHHQLQEYVFQGEESITKETKNNQAGAAPGSDGSLGIGSLRGGA